MIRLTSFSSPWSIICSATVSFNLQTCHRSFDRFLLQHTFTRTLVRYFHQSFAPPSISFISNSFSRIETMFSHAEIRHRVTWFFPNTCRGNVSGECTTDTENNNLGST